MKTKKTEKPESMPIEKIARFLREQCRYEAKSYEEEAQAQLKAAQQWRKAARAKLVFEVALHTKYRPGVGANRLNTVSKITRGRIGRQTIRDLIQKLRKKGNLDSFDDLLLYVTFAPTKKTKVEVPAPLLLFLEGDYGKLSIMCPDSEAYAG
ncbi:MAG TPA: hypothetical protein VJI33_00315 [Candidatus Paceibacterota bacterium]